MRGDAWSDWRAPEGTITPVQERGQLGMARHTFYGLLGGAVVWGAYFALPSEPDAPRGERLILLPAAVLTGAAVGFVTGLLRGAH